MESFKEKSISLSSNPLPAAAQSQLQGRKEEKKEWEGIKEISQNIT